LRAGDGHTPKVGSQQIAFFQNPREHREGGDAHCRSYKKSERKKRSPLNGKFWIERSGQADAKSKGQHNTDIAKQHDCSPLFQNTFEINLKTDHKHEKQESKLTQNPDRGHGRCGENEGKSIRKEATKKRRAEDNACCHFPHNTWLSNALKKPAKHTRYQQNGTNGKDQLFSLHPIAFCESSQGCIKTAVYISPAP
jgi:hypothetical protein